MSDDTKAQEGTTAATPEKLARRFMFQGMELTDIDPSMKPEQVRDLWAGTYGDLQNAKVKGPEKGADGVEVYTFVQNVGKLG